MLYLKSLKLKNYCNYADNTFDFTRPDGSPYPFICFSGPNGVGKSTLLEAIAMLTTPQTGRSNDHIKTSLAKYIRNTDYNPSYHSLRGMDYKNQYIVGQVKTEEPEMLIEGTYVLDDKEYIVAIGNAGYIRNDFAPLYAPDADNEERIKALRSGPWGSNHLRHLQRVAHFLSSDNDLSLNKFQLVVPYAKQFEKMIQQVMRYPAECVMPSIVSDSLRNKDYVTDFVITKSGHRIHFKRMSAGEKKIVKSFSSLLNLMHTLEYPMPGDPGMPGWPRLLLIDNAVMHIYYDRHITMIDCLKEVFSRQQIFATTHSGVLIPRALRGENDQETELWINLEEFV